MARADTCPHVRAVAQQAQGPQDEVAGIERVRRGQQPLVGGVELGELALARAVGLLRPRREALRVDQVLLQPVDPCHDPRQERGGAAAEVVLAQRQVVDVLEQHRQAVGAPERDDERLQACLQRLVVEDARAEVVHRVHGELLVGAVDRLLQQHPQPAPAAGAATSARTDSGSAPSATRRAKRSTSTVVLPVPGPATTSSGPPGCPTTRAWAGVRVGTWLSLRPKGALGRA